MYKSETTLYAEWMLDNLTKDNKRYIQRLKANCTGRGSDKILIHGYSLITEKRRLILARAVKKGKCKAYIVPRLTKQEHFEKVATAMYQIEKYGFATES